MQISFLGITIEQDELLQVWQHIVKQFKKPDSHFSFLNEDILSKALSNAVRFLLNDRVNDGIAKGGWGKSDRLYMTHLYGKEVGNSSKDSIMTTTVVVLALQAYQKILLQAELQLKNDFSQGIWNLLLKDLDEYLIDRWDRISGAGGVLTIGREGDPALTPRYRHTAWLLKLWMSVPRFAHRSLKTLQNLIANYEKQNRQKQSWQKVATPVAAHSALTEALRHETLRSMVDVNLVENIRHCLEQTIIDKFDPDLQGWTSGLTREGGRQTYTLFVLCEMAHIYEKEQSELAQLMSEAFRHTFFGRWSSKIGKGVPRSEDCDEDISMTCLAVSSFLRKPKMTNEERKVFQAILGYLVTSLARSDPGHLSEAYSWAIAYFVRDACDVLAGIEVT